MLVTQFDKFVNRSTHEILGGEIVQENLEPMLSTDINRDVGFVTGVKGEKEIYYRTGNVNLTSDDIGALNVDNVYNGLDRTEAGYALDARQGKVLNESINGKLDKDNVYNGLDQTDPGYALDARQGKVLADDVGALSAAMTYVVSGNKSIETATIPVGAYVRLVGSTIAGRSDGIYTVDTAIPVNTVIDGTYFNESAPIPGGLGGAMQQSLAIKTGTETLTTNANGVVALTNIKPVTHVLIAIYVGNGSYGYMRTDSINSDVFGLQVLNMVNAQSPTKVANTTLTFTYTYLDLST